MKIFYPPLHYDKNYRGHLFPLLKPFIKGDGFTDEQRKSMYGVSQEDYCFVSSMNEAEVVILPMSWYYYKHTKQLDKAQDLVEQAKSFQKIVWSHNPGDAGVKTPQFSNVMVFRFGGYVSRNQKGHKGMPVLIEDYYTNSPAWKGLENLGWEEKPKVGFCGQAIASKANAFKEVTKIGLRNLQTYVGSSPNEPQKLISSTYLRAKALELLQKNSNVKDQFILRKKYRAGVTQQKDTHQTTQEFYQNIQDSQYILCVRGAGNFSVRFYETLMMGRIPLYIHTDGFLPLAEEIEWKKHIVWVDKKEMHKVAEKLLSFHNNLSENQLQELCKANRKLWEEKLCLDGFFKNEFDSLK
ncbi:exostosin family protein [Mesonia ostreae]|uniref:Exostosin GT47 domain-containing protein n=1 Tax=Mesonia ostreae TaxID=861110 RepID=A0ABU2KLZ1_9FLAO|nr:exostosin family protein [Mesonia ostreae]MDT0295731.1 hypothetical protein [Mesonia ostreae]